MKRSEALEEIRKILAMNGKDNGMGELEEALLHTMEVLGMLPPANEGSIKIEEGEDGQLFIPIWRWEEEE